MPIYFCSKIWYNIYVNEIKEITIMITYTKVTTRNVTALAKRTNGNLYFRDRDAVKYRGDKSFQVVDGFMLDELKYALKLGQVDMIWIAGPSLGTNVEVA
jgi:hypothetical protein